MVIEDKLKCKLMENTIRIGHNKMSVTGYYLGSNISATVFSHLSGAN